MILVAGILRLIQFFQNHESAHLSIAGQTITAEIAKTASKRAKGLSGRESLGENEGMLFIFDRIGKPSFWMYGMRFPLDFIWIRGDEIRDITPSVPENYPALLNPREEIDKVLEVNAGFIEKYNIRIGDPLIVDKN